MARRFGAEGKSLQLVNHVQTIREWPWATPRNLQRAIQLEYREIGKLSTTSRLE